MLNNFLPPEESIQMTNPFGLMLAPASESPHHASRLPRRGATEDYTTPPVTGVQTPYLVLNIILLYVAQGHIRW